MNEKKMVGKRSVLFSRPPIIIGAGSVAGEKEGNGAFGKCFDMNLRDATVLGLVGAGGIGAPLIFAMSAYRWNEVGAILLGLIVLVLIIEWISARIRVKLARG